MKNRGSVLGVALLLAGCDFAAIEKCHEQMKSSQQIMKDMDSKEVSEVEVALAAVDKTHSACVKAGRDEEAAKVAGAQGQLRAQIMALKAQAERRQMSQLSPGELKALQKKGDSSCPKGQQYEHHQDKRMIRCTGAQLISMNWNQAVEYFGNRGYASHPQGALLRFEKGAKVYDYQFELQNSKKPARCLSVVAQPGSPWQTVVTRLTGVHPQKLKLGRSISTSRGALALLVEGNDQQYTVKIGDCKATPGQKEVK